MRLFLLFTALLTLSLSWKTRTVFERKDNLSEYGFFAGRLADLTPSEGVIPYDVNTPLFSNYSEKARFIKVPKGSQIPFNDTVSLGLPEGTILIKNFYYPVDARKPEKGRRILETRLLVNEPAGWQAYPYIWNDEQTEAFYDPAGDSKTVTFVNENGKKITTNYVVPNKNQCKGCHIRGGKMVPIGVTARQLNGDYNYPEGKTNQLIHWQQIGMLENLPDIQSVSRLVNWNDHTASLNGRARAYLDANCGHCHSKQGPANTSGLLLDIYAQNPAQLGVNKTPVAAGKGSGNLKFDIVPGDPDHSILVFRMKTVDPSIAMPEIGREQIHKEGVALIEEWIRKNNFGPQPQ